MKKAIIATILSTILITGMCGSVVSAAQILPKDKVYPLYDISGSLTLHIPINSKETEARKYKILEENKDLTCLTVLPEDSDDISDKITIFFVDKRCIFAKHGRQFETYFAYKADVDLDEDIAEITEPIPGSIGIKEYVH